VGNVLAGAIDMVTLAGVAAAPLIVSPVSALTTAEAPVAPLMPVAELLVATRAAKIVSESVAELFAVLVSNEPDGMATVAELTASAAKAGELAVIRTIGKALTSMPEDEQKRDLGDMINSPGRNS
jgi:hypothetical protein